MLATLLLTAANTGADVVADFSDHYIVKEGTWARDHTALSLGNALAVGVFANFFGQANMFIRRQSFLDIGVRGCCGCPTVWSGSRTQETPIFDYELI